MAVQTAEHVYTECTAKHGPSKVCEQVSETEVPLFLKLMRPCYLTIFHELTTDLTVQVP